MVGCKFRRQHAVGRYVVDFACVERRLVIELDGGQHVDRTAQDAERTAFLIANGFRVILFWNDEVMTRLDEVLEVIYAELTSPSP